MQFRSDSRIFPERLSGLSSDFSLRLRVFIKKIFEAVFEVCCVFGRGVSCVQSDHFTWLKLSS